jgi:hypothetical protein
MSCPYKCPDKGVNMTTIADFRTRIRAILVDAGSAIYTDAIVDEALRQALDEYNQALPFENETVITLPGNGREIALNGLAGLRQVTEVYWPFDSLSEPWPPNRARGFHVYWDDAQPVLYLNNVEGDEPQLGDELRLWYTSSHTIDGLDGAAITTLPGEHEALIAGGAAGHAALGRGVDLIEITSADLYGTGLLLVWAQRKLKDFREALEKIRRAHARAGLPYGAGWKLDKWDE